LCRLFLWPLNTVMKQIHVEASTYCNARCPLCPRSLYGYKVEGVYPEVHLQLDRFEECLAQFPEREYVYFNGNLGDPMMNPNISELAMATGCRTSITTNGSIGSKNTWQQLAKNNIEVRFSIDGLEDTNHLYRQDVEWNKIMDRVKWFMDSGGNATWKWIAFKHNVHQRSETERLAMELGFARFEATDHGRNHGPALDKEGNISHWILPADGSGEAGRYDVPAGIDRYRNTHENFFPEEKVYEIECQHETESTVYIDARGRIGPCCYQGFDLPSLPFVELKDFPKLKQSWQTKKCNFVCAMSCGASRRN
jgi:MoaA/NifB/PqqE/SkfB family radical SAM enzyme